MNGSRRIALAIAVSAAICANVPNSMAQDSTSDVTFHQVPARKAIVQLSEGLGRSVVFDYKFAEHDIDFDAQGVTQKEALWRLLEANNLYSIEVGDVLIVAPDTLDSWHNYNARRIAACRIASDKSTATDILFHATPVRDILSALAQTVGKHAVFELGDATARRPYSFETRGATGAEALGVVCLALHLSVRADGETLVFHEAPGNP